MLKIKVKLSIQELIINQGYIERSINEEENTIEENVEMFSMECVQEYELLKNSEMLIDRVEMLKNICEKEEEFGRRNGHLVSLCYKCTTTINEEQEKEALQEVNKEFREYCLDCEKEIEEMNMEIVEEESSLNEIIETTEEGVAEGSNDIMEDIVATESDTNESEIEEREPVIESKVYKDLLKELTVPRIRSRSEVEEDQEESLKESVKKILKEEQKVVKNYYVCGKRYQQEIESRKRRRGQKKGVKAIKGAIKTDLAKEIIGYSRDAIRKRLERAERVYKLFKGIGRDKIERMVDTDVTDIRKLRVNNRIDEVQLLIQEINRLEQERLNRMEE
jgi:hypothetical protein